MTFSKAILTIVGALLAIMLLSQHNDKTQLTGSWKVQEIQYQYADTTYIVNDDDYGRFIFSDQHYALQYNPMMTKREAFKVLSKPDSEEIIKAFRSVVFNSGTYKIENNELHTKADIAKVPGFEGGQQFYKIELSKTSLELVMYDETYPNSNKPEWYGKLKIKFVLKRE